MTLTQQNGTFNTLPSTRRGWNQLEALARSVSKLIQNDSPRLTKRLMSAIHRTCSATHARNQLRTEWTIDNELQPRVTGTIDALTHLISAEAIAALAPDDRRRKPLQVINRTLANQDVSLDIEIDGVNVPRIDHLALAPQARLDVAWRGTLFVCTHLWDTELFSISGRSDVRTKTTLDLRQIPHRFVELMAQRAPFLRVTDGLGWINPEGLRVLRCGSLHPMVHNDLPEALRLHFPLDDALDAQ